MYLLLALSWLLPFGIAVVISETVPAVSDWLDNIVGNDIRTYDN